MDEAEKVYMRDIIGKTNAYVVVIPGEPSRTFVEKPISEVMTDIINAHQVVPTVAGPVSHTAPVEVVNINEVAHREIMSEETGETITIGALLQKNPNMRLARYLITHSICGWVSAEAYNAAGRVMAENGLSPTLAPMPVPGAPIGPRAEEADEVPVAPEPVAKPVPPPIYL